jgi:phosphoglycolate phosphatase-like HAD superfamily hydrolase
MNNKIIVFDIDGTLANIQHRRTFVASKPKNWKAFTAGIPNDTPYEDIVALAQMFFALGNKVILCSGRGEESRDATEKQMKDFGVDFNALYMRPAGDHRQDSIVKVELLAEIRKDFGNPWLWFDDRNQVVDAIRAEGVRVLQVAPGDF